MGYYIDLKNISIDEYVTKLESAYLPPSRMILKEKLDERFGYFKNIGIKNISELIKLLKKKDSLTALSKVNCFSDKYLKILLRELNSIHPKPNKIINFSTISKELITKLENIEIKNTEKLYGYVLTKNDRKKLSDKLEINYCDILEITKLTDLSRIKWVGVTYAQLLYNLGVDTVEKVSKSDPEDLHAKINQRIKDHNVFKGAIGLNDVRILIATANELAMEIEY